MSIQPIHLPSPLASLNLTLRGGEVKQNDRAIEGGGEKETKSETNGREWSHGKKQGALTPPFASEQVTIGGTIWMTGLR